MSSRRFSDIAVIADAHFHDLSADFCLSGMTAAGKGMSLRSWADTRQSTRVFNESAGALTAALDEVARRQVRHVVLLGDYTDDGQKTTTAALAGILKRHREVYGTAFYAMPGNHDIFGPRGRHHTKEFLTGGGDTIMVSSDGKLGGPRTVINDAMYCAGYPEGLAPMSEFGYFRRAEYLHWESPFGRSDAPADRLYDIASPDGRNQYRLMDASYLVEPEDGLWLLMIDANVFEPLNGSFERGEEAAFTDSTAGGWNAMLRAKPFILSWMSDIARRARMSGKALLTFSHYPALDPFDGAADAERVLFGETNVVRRTPRQSVQEAFLAAGIEVHFSGHLHVEGLTQRTRGNRSITNVAVPSLVAFPPAFKIVAPSSNRISVETVELASIPVDEAILDAYRTETVSRREATDRSFAVKSYGEFLRAHKQALVVHRYLAKEWPAPVAASIAAMGVWEAAHRLTDALPILDPAAMELAKQLPMTELVADWYCLKQGSRLAIGHLENGKLELYRKLADCCGQRPQAHDGSTEGFLAIFFGALGTFLERAQNAGTQAAIAFDAAAGRISA